MTTIDLKTGKIIRAVSVAASPYTALLDTQTSHLFAFSMGALGTGNLAKATNGAVTTIDTRTGKIVRAVTVGPLAILGQLDSQTHHLFVLSLKKADKAGQAAPGAGRLHMLDTRSGALLHTAALPGIDVMDTSFVLDSTNGRIYFTYAPGGPQNPNSLTVVDTHTGSLLPAIQLPSQPDLSQ